MGRQFVYGAVLVTVLSVMWLVLSGYWYKPLLVGFGVLAVTLAMALTIRMRLLDGESVPYSGLVSFLSYWGWLGGEIVKSNVYVVKTAMAPSLDIHPVLTRVPVTAQSDMARATFANSITLTPGTVTVEVEETGFLVHALTPELTGMDGFREMERRSIEASEGRKPR